MSLRFFARDGHKTIEAVAGAKARLFTRAMNNFLAAEFAVTDDARNFFAAVELGGAIGRATFLLGVFRVKDFAADDASFVTKRRRADFIVTLF